MCVCVGYLVTWIADCIRGSADLVAYFFLSASKLARSFGYLATNTIAQGDTSRVGLSQLIDAGWRIHRAVSSVRWPGSTSLEIAKCWICANEWRGQSVLDDRIVNGIDEMLYPISRSGWRKKRLACNKNQSFQGSIVLGDGFIMSPEEAQALIDSDQRNAEVLFPYLGGEDLNQSPTQSAPRWVINFFDRSLQQARRYPDCFAIIEEKVKPQRSKNNRKAIRDYWWRYAEHRPGLNRSISRNGSCISHFTGQQDYFASVRSDWASAFGHNHNFCLRRRVRPRYSIKWLSLSLGCPTCFFIRN